MLELPYYKINRVGEVLTDSVSVKDVEFVFLSKRNKRAFFPSASEEGNQILCASDDCVMPSRGAEMQPGPCANCALARWSASEGKSIPPACMEIWELLCYDMQKKKPFVFSVKRASIKPFKAFITELTCRVDLEQDGFPPELGVVGKLSVIEEKSGKRSYFLPKFEILRGSTQEETKMMQKIRNRLGYMQKQEEEERQGYALLQKKYKEISRESPNISLAPILPISSDLKDEPPF